MVKDAHRPRHRGDLFCWKALQLLVILFIGLAQEVSYASNMESVEDNLSI